VILEWHSITEPGAVATGCKHSTNPITSLMNQLSLGSGRYRSRLCSWVAFESRTNPPIYSQLRSGWVHTFRDALRLPTRYEAVKKSKLRRPAFEYPQRQLGDSLSSAYTQQVSRISNTPNVLRISVARWSRDNLHQTQPAATQFCVELSRALEFRGYLEFEWLSWRWLDEEEERFWADQFLLASLIDALGRQQGEERARQARGGKEKLRSQRVSWLFCRRETRLGRNGAGRQCWGNPGWESSASSSTFQGERPRGLSGPTRVNGVPQRGQRSGSRIVDCWLGLAEGRLLPGGGCLPLAASSCRTCTSRWRWRGASKP